jgi:hypothetical protein
MGSRIVVLSPHLDDAVLSCWHRLQEGDVKVVNVFTGLPDAGTAGWWDILTGASDSVARMHERLREDARALETARAHSVGLGLLDEQYRHNGRPPPVAESLAEHLGEADEVYVSAGLALGSDHGLVLAGALELRDDLCLYADLPHAALWGWPSWVTGAGGEDDLLDVDAAWRARLRDAGLDPRALRPEAHALDDLAFERKLQAVRCYRTQVAALEREAPLAALRWEVTWRP